MGPETQHWAEKCRSDDGPMRGGPDVCGGAMASGSQIGLIRAPFDPADDTRRVPATKRGPATTQAGQRRRPKAVDL